MDNNNIRTITLKDGRKYSVRHDRHRYFFPDEWDAFIKGIKNETHYLLFLTLINTGARIMEALHIKPEDFDHERKTISLKVVKNRAAKKNIYAANKARVFRVSDRYLRRVRAYLKSNPVASNKYIFLDNHTLPPDYDSLSNLDKKKYFHKKVVAYSQLFKRKLGSTEMIKDPENFSLHNIRKTYGNWIKTYDLHYNEVCYRMGHDIETFLAHYGSADIFTNQEKRKIKQFYGEIS